MINNTCPVCDTETLDQYIVTDECWEEAGFTFYQNVHLHCLVGELHRDLSLADFPDVPVNFNMPQILEHEPRLPQDKVGQWTRRVHIDEECQRRHHA